MRRRLRLVPAETPLLVVELRDLLGYVKGVGLAAIPVEMLEALLDRYDTEDEAA